MRWLTLAERAASYARVFPDRPELQLVREAGECVLYGTWVGGNDYRNESTFYGSYPPGYLDRVMALYPDVATDTAALERSTSVVEKHWPILHAFSGSLPRGPYTRLDVRSEPAPGIRPDVVASVYDVAAQVLPWRSPFDLVLADPPYSAADAEKYETAGVDRRRAMAALAQVTGVGRHLVWLDCCWPMHAKTDWRTVGRISFIRSTNHRVRLISIFERRAA